MTSEDKLENCEVCKKEKAKYTCPKCEVRTCSLTCSNIHKKELECDGIRDKTKYLPIKAITELELASDYCLLQEAGRCVDKCNRDSIKRVSLNNLLPVFLRKLKYAAFKRGVSLEFLPRSFSRNRENTTRFIWNKNELLWRVDWIFPQGENIKWTTPKASERATLSVLIENVLEPEIKANDDPEVHNLKFLLRKKLQFYRSAGLNGIKVLMKAEKVRNSSSRFYELDLNLTLAENLEQKSIIEFPTFYVILSENSDMYEIIDETEIRQKKILRHQQNLQNSNEKVKSESINFLFHTEFTDSEDEKAKIEKAKNTNNQKRKRKGQRNQRGQMKEKIIKTRDLTDLGNKVTLKRNIQGTVTNSQEVFSETTIDEKSSQVEEPPMSKFFTYHITDSEDDGPEETPIQRLLSDKDEGEIKNESVSDTNKNSEENKSAIQSIAMNYFSAYMSDSEEEAVSEKSENTSNSGLQIPDYQVLVKMNH